MFFNNTWIYISDEAAEVEVILILEKYELASNAKVNLSKSRCKLIGKMASLVKTSNSMIPWLASGEE